MIIHSGLPISAGYDTILQTVKLNDVGLSNRGNVENKPAQKRRSFIMMVEPYGENAAVSLNVFSSMSCLLID